MPRLRPAVHAYRGDIDQHLRALVTQLGLPAITQRIRQGASGPLVTGDNQTVLVATIAQGAGHRFGHAAAAAQGEGRILRHRVAFQQLRDGDVIGVVGLEVAASVDDGVDRLDRRRRRIQLIDQRNAGFLERHRHAAAANAQCPDAADRAGQVLAAERFVIEIQAQLFIQMVVKTQTEIPRPPRQGHAQLGVFVRVHLHETSPSNALSDGRDWPAHRVLNHH